MKSLVTSAILCVSILCNSATADDCFISFCDLNDDGKVNCLDFGIMLQEFSKEYYSDPEDPNSPHYKLIKSSEQNRLLREIEIGLELFRNDFAEYPYSWQRESALTIPDPNLYMGSNILTEALLGLDLLGFHHQSYFRSDGLNPNTGQPLYITGPDMPMDKARASINMRAGTFLDLDEVHVFRLEDIYEDVGEFNGSSLVLCDVYERTRHSGKKTGMPILFFKARPWNISQDYQDAEGIEDDIYYYPDNKALLELGTAGNAIPRHPLGDGVNDFQDFENMVLDTRVTVWKMPHRRDSYILVSAGPDGLYGTGDDVCNYQRY